MYVSKELGHYAELCCALSRSPPSLFLSKHSVFLSHSLPLSLCSLCAAVPLLLLGAGVSNVVMWPLAVLLSSGPVGRVLTRASHHLLSINTATALLLSSSSLLLWKGPACVALGPTNTVNQGLSAQRQPCLQPGPGWIYRPSFWRKQPVLPFCFLSPGQAASQQLGGWPNLNEANVLLLLPTNY